MAESLACSQAWVFGAFSAALVASGLAAPFTGRAIDRYGGRCVLSAGSALAALALAAIASASSLSGFVAGWLLAGLAMSATLYEAAFPALSQFAGERYRAALTALTLFGGLASTAFWPLSWQLEHSLGWRSTLLVFAGLHLGLCLPLHRWLLPGPGGAGGAGAALPRPVASRKALHDRGLGWLAASFALNAFVFSAIGAHVVAMLVVATGSTGEAVMIAALIGPLQVAGRVMEFAFARRVPAQQVGLATLALTVLSMLMLWQVARASWMPIAFALVYGGANGVMTIVRAAVPAELFGRERYGALMGWLSRPAFLAKAAAPLGVAVLLSSGISHADLALLLALLSAAALFAFRAAIRALSPTDPQLRPPHADGP